MLADISERYTMYWAQIIDHCKVKIHTVVVLLVCYASVIVTSTFASTIFLVQHIDTKLRGARGEPTDSYSCGYDRTLVKNELDVSVG